MPRNYNQNPGACPGSINGTLPKPQFIHLAECYYSDQVLNHQDYHDEISFGVFTPTEGITGVISLKWFLLDGLLSKYLITMECSSKSFLLLLDYANIFKEFITLQSMLCTNLTPQAVVGILVRNGFEDATPRINPRTNDPF
jgi:hypothetical protein